MVHRDLKPGNILVTADGQLKIADFGLAKLAGAATRTETFKGGGTLPYMAPEAYDGTDNTIAMDVYSCGVIFHELAAFAWPIQPRAGDQRFAAWARAHLLENPADLRTLRPDLPLDLAQLIVQMLEKNPAKRPTSWADITKRLNKGLVATNGPDVSALVSKATARYQKSVREELQAQEAREQQEIQTALMEQAFKQPVEVLRSVVDAFNQASDIGRLTLRESESMRVEVTSAGGPGKLILSGQIADLEILPHERARIIATVELRPAPTLGFDSYREYPNSFEGFNLVYKLSRKDDRYGEWLQFRFELNPLVRERRTIRWHAVSLGALPRELRLLRAMGRYQHETRPLDEKWFAILLEQIV